MIDNNVVYKLIVILTDGSLYGLLALGIYVAFQWLRFPDLTPDGSFATGGDCLHANCL